MTPRPLFSVFERDGWWIPVVKHPNQRAVALARKVGLLEASAFVIGVLPNARWLEPQVFAVRYMR